MITYFCCILNQKTYFQEFEKSSGYNKVTLSLIPVRLVKSLSWRPSKDPQRPSVLFTSNKDGYISMSICQDPWTGHSTMDNLTLVPVGREIFKLKKLDANII